MSFIVAAILGLASALSVPSAGLPVVQRLLAKLPNVDRTGQAAGADVGLWIGPDGKIISCEFKQVVGDEALAALFCNPLIGFKVGKPVARDGSSTFGYIETTLTVFPDSRWSVREQLLQDLRKRRADALDEGLQPPGEAEGISVGKPHLVVEVSEAGTITACEPANRKIDEVSATLACQSLIGGALATKSDASGRAVRYVRSFGSLVE